MEGITPLPATSISINTSGQAKQRLYIPGVNLPDISLCQRSFLKEILTLPPAYALMSLVKNRLYATFLKF